MQPNITLDTVRQALDLPRPGIGAQQRMAPNPRHRAVHGEQGQAAKQSAVLLLLYPLDDTLGIVLTRRSERLRHHKGQVSLPGGGQEPQDRSLAHTAFREAEEELGISLDEAQLLGELTPIHTGSSNFEIHPFVAYISERPNGLPSEAEVDEVLYVSLFTLMDHSCQCAETWPLHGQPVLVPFFSLGGHKVWGATAMILSEFITLLEQIVQVPST